jgi:hypothetical protein
MPAYTSRLALPYPLGTDPPNGPGQIESLANVLDAAVGSTLIASQVLTVAEPSVTFSAIPQDFNHLLVKAVLRTTYAGGYLDSVKMTLNGDTGNHYDVCWTENVEGTFTSGDTVVGASAQVAVAMGTYGTANVAGALDIEIPCYALTTFQKAFTSRSGYYDAVTAPTNYSEGLYRGLWRSTAAITSLALAPTTGPNFTIGSAFYLSGIY